MAILNEEDGAILVKLSNDPGSIPVKGIGGGEGGLTEVHHDATLSGKGTESDPLSVVGGSGGTSDYDELENKPVWLAEGVTDKGWDINTNGGVYTTISLTYNDVNLFEKLNVNLHEGDPNYGIGCEIIEPSDFNQIIANDTPIKIKWSDDEGEIELDYKNRSITAHFIAYSMAYGIERDEDLDLRVYGNFHLIDETETDSGEDYCALITTYGDNRYFLFMMSTKTEIPEEVKFAEIDEREPGDNYNYQLVNNETFEWGESEGDIKISFEYLAPENTDRIDIEFRYSTSNETSEDYVETDWITVEGATTGEYTAYVHTDWMSYAGSDDLYTWVMMEPRNNNGDYLPGGKIRNIIISKPESYESDTAMPVGGGDGRWDENGMPRIYNVPDVGIRYREGFENAWLKSLNVGDGLQGNGTESGPLRANIITDGSTIQGNGTSDDPLHSVVGSTEYPDTSEWSGDAQYDVNKDNLYDFGEINSSVTSLQLDYWTQGIGIEGFAAQFSLADDTTFTTLTVLMDGNPCKYSNMPETWESGKTYQITMVNGCVAIGVFEEVSE